MTNVLNNRFAITGTWILMALVLHFFMGVGLIETGILMIAVVLIIKTVSKMKFGMRIIGYGVLSSFYGLMVIAFLQEGIKWLTL